MPTNLSALDRLRKAANLEPVKKEVTLSDGSVFEMYVTPLTMVERERAQRLSKDDNNNFALQLLLTKALDENGRKLFNAGEIDVLKNGYLQTFLNDFRDVVRYDKNSSYITSSLVSTENTETVNP